MTPDQGSGEKTEKATPKKREDARKKGQVLKSAEINTAVMTLVMFATLYFFGGWFVDGMRGFLVRILSRMGENTSPMTLNTGYLVIVDGVYELLRIVLPLFLAAMVIGVVVNIAQVGFLFTAESIMPKFSKINPLEGFKRIFSMRSLVEMLKAVLKITIVGVVVYQEYIGNIDKFPGMLSLTVPQAAAEIFSMCMSVAFKAVLALFALGIADYLYQWWEYEKNLKMTKEEVKQEYKQQEGDPMVKSKRRERQRQMSMARMMQAVPNADVVITNPTHYAIALRYDEKEAPSPIVLAKGKDLIAQKIKDVARESKVEIVENKPVAQALYIACDIGDQIPEDMFAAVAEILAYVYKLKNPQRR